MGFHFRSDFAQALDTTTLRAFCGSAAAIANTFDTSRPPAFRAAKVMQEPLQEMRSIRREYLMGRTSRQKPLRLANKLLAIRQALGLSQNELIRHLGMEEDLIQGTISAYELGNREPSVLVLLNYARAAGVYVDVLVDDELDLPAKLPARPKSKGIRSNSRRRPK